MKNLRKKFIAAKREATEGVDASPNPATDAVYCSEPTISPLEGEYKERNVVRGFMGASPQMLLGEHVVIEFEVELAGQKGLGVPTPGLSALLRCCGVSETIVASTSVDYALIDSGYDSTTIYFDLDGILHKLTGARGNVSFDFAGQALPSLKFRVMGLFNPATDTSSVTHVYSDFKQPVEVSSANTTFSLHSSSPVLISMSIDLGNELKLRDFPGGGKSIRITDRKVTGSVSVEGDTLAVKNWIQTVRNATTGALSLAHGPSGNRFECGGSVIQLTEPKYGDSEGLMTYDMSMLFLPTNGNDELWWKHL